MYLVAKHIYMDNGNVYTVGFAIDKENLRILKAKIDAALIDDSKPNQEKRLDKQNYHNILLFNLIVIINNSHYIINLMVFVIETI